MNMEIITLKNGHLSIGVLRYGAIIQSINAFGLEVAAGFDTVEEYIADECCFGSIVGRTSNRALGNQVLDGKQYSLSLNENGVTHLHGGFEGFGKKIWDVAARGGNFVTLTYTSQSGEEGYPGNLCVAVTYTVQDNALLVRYTAKTDAPTWVGLTNHTYFNSDGIGSGSIFGKKVTVNADFVSVKDALSRVAGRTEAAGEFDLKNGRAVECEYDHNFYLCGDKKRHFEGRELSYAATLEGRVDISVYTDMPCMQFYTGNFIPDNTPVSGGNIISKHGALCFETQFEPGLPHECILREGELYDKMTVFTFEKSARM